MEVFGVPDRLEAYILGLLGNERQLQGVGGQRKSKGSEIFDFLVIASNSATTPGRRSACTRNAGRETPTVIPGLLAG